MMIHQIYGIFDDGINLDQIHVFKKNVEITKEFCKEHNYDYKMWSLKDCEELIVEKYPEYIPVWTEFRYPIQKADFIRYLILYEFGGWYVDCDVYPIQDLNLLEGFDECFTTWNNDIHRKPYNAVIKVVAKNPLMLKIMEEVERRVIEKQSIKQYDSWKGRLVFYTTGHRMLASVVPKSSIHDLMLIHNEEKGIYVTSDNPYFYDENASTWWE
jgi:mannosyltransferase OCH1-like enzyme